MFGKSSWLGVRLVLIAIFLIVSVIGLYKNAQNANKEKRRENKAGRIYSVIPLTSVFVMLLSWFFNFGIIHFALLITAIPFIHTSAFLFGNLCVYQHLKEQNKLNLLCLISSIAFLVFYVFIPDGTGRGYMYVLFGLIKNYYVIECSQYISGAGFAISVICILTQFALAIKLRKKGGKNEKHR